MLDTLTPVSPPLTFDQEQCGKFGYSEWHAILIHGGCLLFTTKESIEMTLSRYFGTRVMVLIKASFTP